MDPTFLLIAAVLAVFIFMQFRSAKRRKTEAETRLSTIVPGVEVMTVSGIFGTLVSIDEEENFAFVEIAPKVIIKLHTQSIRHAVTPPEVEEPADESLELDDSDESAPELNESSAVPMTEPESEPKFGERTKKSPRKKPTSDSE